MSPARFPEAFTPPWPIWAYRLVPTAPPVKLMAPVPVAEAGVLAGEFYGAAAKSRALAPLLADLARHRGTLFLDAGLHAQVSPIDGVHLTPEAHASLGQAVAQALG